MQSCKHNRFCTGKANKKANKLIEKTFIEIHVLKNIEVYMYW
jgi:hypothetical protein